MLAFMKAHTGNYLDPVKREPRWDNAWEKFWDLYSWMVGVAVIALLFGLLIWLMYRDKLKNTTVTVTYLDFEEFTCKYGDRLIPPVPKREGYAFYGWFKDTAFSEPWKSTDKVKKDLTLYPKWVKES